MNSQFEYLEIEINKHIELLLDENKRKSNSDFKFFLTESGIKFDENYQGLFNFTIGAITIPSWSSKLLMSLHDNIMKNEWGTTLDKIMDYIIENVPKEENKEVFRRLINDKNYPLIKGKVNKLQESIRIPKGSSGIKSWIDNNLFSRITAYYVFSLYTYIDTYCLCIVQQIISLCDEDQLFEILSKINVYGSPAKKIEAIVRALSNDDSNIEKLFKISLEKHNLKYINKTLKNLISVRNQIAHRKPLADLDELIKMFPEQFQRTQADISKFKESIPEQADISQITRENTINFVIDEFKIISIYKEVGNTCFLYISILDKIFHTWMKNMN